MIPIAASAPDDVPRAEGADGTVNRHFIRLLSPGVLVCRPNLVQYGHLAMELVMALDEARRRNHAIVLLKSRRAINPSLFDIESPDVRILRHTPLMAAWARLAWALGEIRDRAVRAHRNATHAVREELARELRRHAGDHTLPPRLRVVVKQLASAAQLPARRRNVGRPYLRRQNVREPVRVRMTDAALQRALRAAQAIGIPHDAPLVVVHARESGFKRGREVNDNPRKSEWRDDSLRNARIETYFSAIDELVSRGYIVVRVGDASMTPVRRPGVIDLATDPRRIPELDLYCLLRSRFAVLAEAGPGQAALLTNTPTLTVNAADPISSYPIRAHGRYLLKRVDDLETGRRLSLRDMLSERYLRWHRQPTVFRYTDNTPEEILEAVREMLEVVAGPVSETASQARYRELATAAGDALRGRLRYVRKFGPDEGFLGDGLVGRAFVEANL